MLSSYMLDFSYPETSQRLGMSSSAIRSIVDSNRELLDTMQSERQLRTKVDSDYILASLKELRELNVMDIHRDDGTIKPLSEWPEKWLKGVNNIEVKEFSGDDGEPIGRVSKLRYPDKVKCLELMGKHVGVKAFSEKIELEDVSEIGRQLALGLENANKSRVSHDDEVIIIGDEDGG
ncbi:terminase small subunit [Bathymodiolus japonicus methanotrophic gill symbiont]|uniref:terminase small subunit n=1 Tax=Bathymodiolus japonicus methanotrophic gill symbiont TaxID=113269 RepID=UPI001C8E7C7F|nr:terminase small subunit [Bathymodiolus japonicus methanotrophic gill symbiont]